MNVVIADAGPLIALSRIKKLEILRLLFQQVVITEPVHDELFDNNHCAGKMSLSPAIEAGWLAVNKIKMENWKPINKGVDAGEASAIYLACQHPNSILIIDDQAGRAEARYQNIQVIGTAAVIGMAKLQNHIVSASVIMQQLKEAGYYIGDKIVARVLQDVGE